MASEIITPSNITFALGILGVIFTCYIYFRTPQEQLDKRQAVTEKEIDGKASLLAQQVQWEKESSEKRFAEMGQRIAASTTMAQNHIHTVDTKVDALTTAVSAMHLEMTKSIIELSTIISERIPKK